MQNESTVYEVGFHINPHLPEGEVLGKVTDLKQAISERGGIFISEGFPSLYPLAYTITKRIGNDNKRFTQTFFGWIKFEMSPASIVDFKKVLENDTDMIRFLIIKTVREDTMISNKPEFKLSIGEEVETDDDTGDNEGHEKEGVADTELSEEDEAEIDKEIEDLVSDESSDDESKEK